MSHRSLASGLAALALVSTALPVLAAGYTQKSASWWGDRGRVVGVANQTDFYRGVTDGELTATATPVHRGRTQQVWQVVIQDAARMGARRIQEKLPPEIRERIPAIGKGQ